MSYLHTPPSATPGQRPRIAIVGGGSAGIGAARALKHISADVLLIERRNHHIFQPLLYQVASAVLAPSEVAATLRQLEQKQANLSVMLAEVTVIRDAAAAAQDGRFLAGVAQVAIQQGRFVGHLIAGRLRGDPVAWPFRYWDLGSMAVVGKNFAVFERGRWRLSGLWSWFLWALSRVMFLPQLQNRLRVQTQWLWSYLTGQRSSRLMPEPPHDPNSTDAVAVLAHAASR